MAFRYIHEKKHRLKEKKTTERNEGRNIVNGVKECLKSDEIKLITIECSGTKSENKNG